MVLSTVRQRFDVSRYVKKPRSIFIFLTAASNVKKRLHCEYAMSNRPTLDVLTKDSIWRTNGCLTSSRNRQRDPSNVWTLALLAGGPESSSFYPFFSTLTHFSLHFSSRFLSALTRFLSALRALSRSLSAFFATISFFCSPF